MVLRNYNKANTRQIKNMFRIVKLVPINWLNSNDQLRSTELSTRVANFQKLRLNRFAAHISGKPHQPAFHVSWCNWTKEKTLSRISLNHFVLRFQLTTEIVGECFIKNVVGMVKSILYKNFNRVCDEVQK